MDGNLTIGALLAQGLDRLLAAAIDPATAPLDAEVLLGYAAGMSRTQLRTHPDTVPSTERAQRYGTLIERRARGEPVAYITGHREFWSLPLTVTPAVLVPRPDTELLVERALALRREAAGRVLDLGTGSGAIALALASERPAWSLTATDLSEEAVAVARDNAKALGLEHIEFLVGDWFEPVAARRFDLILSNPPYVADRDPALLDPALQHEPRLALTAGPEGMTCLHSLIRQAPLHLERRGWLLLEHGSGQAVPVARELVVRGFSHVRSHRDLAGHERMTEAQWP